MEKIEFLKSEMKKNPNLAAFLMANRKSLSKIKNWYIYEDLTVDTSCDHSLFYNCSFKYCSSHVIGCIFINTDPPMLSGNNVIFCSNIGISL